MSSNALFPTASAGAAESVVQKPRSTSRQVDLHNRQNRLTNLACKVTAIALMTCVVGSFAYLAYDAVLHMVGIFSSWSPTDLRDAVVGYSQF